MKRRWPLLLLAGVLLLISVAILVTLLSARTLEGAVPGRAPLLGLAVSHGRYLAATETGLYVSRDGTSWTKPGPFAGRPALVTSLAANGAVVLSGRRLFVAEASGDFSEFVPGRVHGTAIAASGGSLYVSQGAETIKVVSDDCLAAASPELRCDRTGLFSTLRVKGGPGEILTLDVVPADPPLFLAGGLRAGVWRSADPEQSWQRVLQTPARAIMVDDVDPDRIFLATAGGLLVSTDRALSWSFTGMRQPVEALAQSGNAYFALAGDRLIYESSGGQVYRPIIHASPSGP